MTHDEVELRDYVDRYLRGELDEATRSAFEEHYFECGQCFAALQEGERVRHAVAAGVARGWFDVGARGGPQWAWMAAAAVLLLSAALGWTVLYRIPQLRAEVERAQAARAASLVLEAPAAAPAPVVESEANVPMITLRAERASADLPLLKLRRGAQHVVITLDAPIGIATASLEIAHADGGAIVIVRGLEPNAAGAFVVTTAASRFAPGSYVARLRSPSGALVGEFLMRVETAP